MKNDNILKNGLAEYDKDINNLEFLIKKRISKCRTYFIVSTVMAVVVGIVCTFLDGRQPFLEGGDLGRLFDTFQLVLGGGFAFFGTLCLLNMFEGMSDLKDYYNNRGED